MIGKFLCPRCFEEQSISAIEYICSNTSTSSKCQHAIDRMPQHPANLKKPVCEECSQPLVTKICPKCGAELPLNIGTAKSYPIAVIGAKETGKSNYVAVLINQLKNEIGRAFNCALMACGDKTLNRYRTEFYEPLYRKKTCVRGSDAGDVDPLIYSLIFQRKGKLFRKAVNDAVSLTFFDTAG